VTRDIEENRPWDVVPVETCLFCDVLPPWRENTCYFEQTQIRIL
jgi:hypothetical protein